MSNANDNNDNIRLPRRQFIGAAGLAAMAAALPGVAATERTGGSADATKTPAPGMNHKRRLGPLEVSPMGLGCMSGSAFFFPLPGKARMISVIRQAYERGVTLFDTAELYGPFTNEELVGEAIRPFRKDIVLASKFGFSYDGNQSTGADSRPATIRRAVEFGAELEREPPSAEVAAHLEACVACRVERRLLRAGVDLFSVSLDFPELAAACRDFPRQALHAAAEAVAEALAEEIATAVVEEFGAAVRKEDKELLDKLNKGFEMLKADPYWEELIAKHLNK